MRRPALVLVAACVALMATAAAVTVSVRALGRWLMVDDPIAPAGAVVVLGGGFPFRAIEAASIYREGWASEVWLPRPGDPVREATLARLGFESSGEHVSNAAVLARQGVPADVVRVLPGLAQDTAEELEAVAKELARWRGAAVILVTSKPHTRRVRTTWRAVGGQGSRAIIRYAREEPFEAARWWANSRDALAVSREVFGLMHVWAGMPLRAGHP